MDVLVVGGSGLVGKSVCRAAEQAGLDVIATHYRTPTECATVPLDIRDGEDVLSHVERIRPKAIVNAAALSSVDTCETHPHRAWATNALGSRNLALAADRVGAQFVYISSDYVFAGDPDDAPYRPGDPVAPPNVYGRTKYAGETAAALASSSAILRTAGVYGPERSNFLMWALGRLRRGDDLEVVEDRVATPTYVEDLGDACIEVVSQDVTGTFHAAGPTRASWYETAIELVRAFGWGVDRIRPIASAEQNQPAPRPGDSSLDSTRLYERVETRFRSPREAFEALRQHERLDAEPARSD